LPSVLPAPRAQAKKPSQVLRQIEDQEKKITQAFQRKTAQALERTPSAKAGPPAAAQPDPDEIDESVIKFAAERVAGFKIGDWNEDELYTLANLYQIAEQYGSAADAYQAYLKNNAKSKLGPGARGGLIRSLIETGKLGEAAKLLEGTEWDLTDNSIVLVDRTGLYKDLALILHSQAKYVEAAAIAEEGYKLASLLARHSELAPALREGAEENQVILGATMVAASERTERKKRAIDLNRRILGVDLNRRPELRSVYESELTAARLIGTTAPELIVARWLEGTQSAPKSLSELRGKVVLLDFSAMWCAPCAVAFPRQREFQTKYAGKGFEVIGVTKLYGRSDHEEAISKDQEFKSLQEYRAKYQLSYPLAVGKMDDVTNEERYGVTGIPTVILVDRHGRVRRVKRGIGEYRKLDKQIEALVAEK
jgi:thiol-disulfide isomerase/thioredoxin